MNRSARSQKLGEASKINRDPRSCDELIDQGEAAADDFVAALGFERAWHAGDEDAVIGLLRRRLRDQFGGAVRPRGPAAGGAVPGTSSPTCWAPTIVVDLTRKQMSGDQVRWRIRTTGRSTVVRCRYRGVAVRQGQGHQLSLGPLA